MGFVVNRVESIAACLDERIRFGLPERTGAIDRDVVFILCGVGGFQFAPLLIRRALRRAGTPLATIMYRWQTRPVGEIFSDLVWQRRNRVMAATLARRIRAVHRGHPRTAIHLVAFSGGAGIAVWACEFLRRSSIIESLTLVCPAISPDYNLAAALQVVNRAYAMVSRRDRFLLGIGTRLLGTTDRQFTVSAGQCGFVVPRDASSADRALYERMRQIRWTPAMKQFRHHGGHTGWGSVRFLQTHLPPLFRGEPLLATEPIPPQVP